MAAERGQAGHKHQKVARERGQGGGLLTRAEASSEACRRMTASLSAASSVSRSSRSADAASWCRSRCGDSTDNISRVSWTVLA